MSEAAGVEAEEEEEAGAVVVEVAESGAGAESLSGAAVAATGPAWAAAEPWAILLPRRNSRCGKGVY